MTKLVLGSWKDGSNEWNWILNTCKYGPHCMKMVGINKQYWTLMGYKKFQRSTLLVSMSKYGRKLYICRKKDTPPPKKLPITVCKIVPIFVASLVLLDVINEWTQFICLCKKWIIVFIVNKSNFIYFTWFVYTFVNYKYNVLLKRDYVCLIPLSTL